MRQGGNPGRSQDRNSGGKTIKERLSNIATAFQADRKRRKPPHTASPIITTTAAAAAAAAPGNGRGSSHDRNRRAAPAPLKSPALQHFVPTHTPDRPSRPVRDAPSEEECYALFSGGRRQRQQQQQQKREQQYQQHQGAAAAAAAAATPPSLSLPTTRHGSFASTGGGGGGSGSSGHGSGVLVVHLDSPPPPLYEQPRPAPMPWLTSSGGGPPGTEGWRHNQQQQQQQQQYYRSSPSPMRQQSAASSRSGSTTTTTHRHRNKELPPLRTDDSATAHMWRGEGRPRGMRREDDCDHGSDAGYHQPSRGEFSPSLSPSRHGRPRKAAAAAACRLCRRRACELSVGQQDATLCRHCELAPMSAAMARARGESGSVSSLSSGSHYGDDESPARQRRRRAQESEPLDDAAAACSEYSSRVGSVSGDSRAGSPFPLEVARGVALTATPCSPREVDVVGSPASARSDADPRHPHHTFDFGFSTAHAAEEEQDRGGARGDAAVGPATTPRRRLVVVEQRPVIVADDGDEALDWGTQWSPAYYFGEPGAGEAGGGLGKAVRRQLEADNERASGGSHDSMSPEPTPTSPILSRLPSEDRITRAGVLCVPKRREEPTLFI
ncbi:hypothetical protein RB598_004006 [Gaeumannomyces tritici]